MKQNMKSILFLGLVLTMALFAGLKAVHAIDAESCTNCGLREETCPENAISAGEVDGQEVYIIDPALCTNCGLCAESCPVEAIAEAEVAIPE